MASTAHSRATRTAQAHSSSDQDFVSEGNQPKTYNMRSPATSHDSSDLVIEPCINSYPLCYQILKKAPVGSIARPEVPRLCKPTCGGAPESRIG